MKKVVNKIPTHIPVISLGRRQNLVVLNGNTGDPINPKPKQQNKRSTTTMNNKFFGVISLVVKVSLLVAGVALWKMPTVHFILDIPLYQLVGSVQLAVLVYLELEPHFSKNKKAKKQPTVPHTNPRPSDFIATTKE